ncbi:MAG: hypothetical protein ACTHPD_04630 [Rhizomicrobium sp.]|jgi:hypothetical protein
MTKPIDIKRFAHLLSADNTLDEIERRLRQTGDRRTARKIANVRDVISRAIEDEKESLCQTLLQFR